MRMASAATAHVVAEMIEDEGVALEESNIVLLAGSGDNGGDGLFAATMLASNGASVTAVAVGRTLHGEGFAAFVRAGGKVLILDPASEIPGCAAGFSAGEAGERLRAAVELAQHAHVIIDAMTGIGSSGRCTASRARSHPRWASTARSPTAPPFPPATRPASSRWSSRWTSSGVGVDDGAITGPYIPADVTVTFGALKPCLMLPPAAYACGRVTLVDFSFDIDGHMPFVEAVSGDNAAETVRLPGLQTRSTYVA